MSPRPPNLPRAHELQLKGLTNCVNEINGHQASNPSQKRGPINLRHIVFPQTATIMEEAQARIFGHLAKPSKVTEQGSMPKL